MPLAVCRFSGLRITPDREWFGPGDITADLAEVNAGSAQLFPPPGFLTANRRRQGKIVGKAHFMIKHLMS